MLVIRRSGGRDKDDCSDTWDWGVDLLCGDELATFSLGKEMLV